MPPSITFWNRLEPRPYANSIAESIAAPIRDPLWMLARQWQVGEFCASDVGSVVYADLKGQAGPFLAWKTDDAKSSGSLTGPVALEPAVQSEQFAPDLATRVELGQWFEALLGSGAGDHMIDFLRSTYPLPLVIDSTVDHLFDFTGSLAGLDSGTMPVALVSAFGAKGIPLVKPKVWLITAGKQWAVTDTSNRMTYAIVTSGGSAAVYLCRDAEALRFLSVCSARASDGVAILQVAMSGAAILTARPEWTAAQVQALTSAGNALQNAVQAVYGSIGFADAPAWVPNRLALELTVDITSASNATANLKATPGDSGEFDWTSFDVLVPNGSAAPGAMAPLSKTAVPGHVRFRGMPEPRWWEFETSQTDFGGIQPEKRDLSKLIFMDFMLIHGDDWYLMPLDVPVGSAAMISSLLVHDVFGITTQIDRADANVVAGSVAAPGQQWTMFSPAVLGQPPHVTPCLLVPPSTAATAITGRALEEVRLVRDPVADMVWGIEVTTESATGRPWPGRERLQGGKPSQVPKAPAAVPPPLQYRLHTPVPVHWFPLVPTPQGTGYVLERAALPGDDPGGSTPSGRILRATQIREQEISTQGTAIARNVCRSRWIDGSTHLWIARSRKFGAGQGSSGIRFDVAESQPDTI
jgi:hypothetical protein